MSYLDNIFLKNIAKNNINVIFELGSRDLLDARKLQNYYNSSVYSFECNPDCLIECDKNMATFDANTRKNINLIQNAVSLTDGDVSFFPFDLKKYDNIKLFDGFF